MKQVYQIAFAFVLSALLPCLAWTHVTAYPERVAPGSFEKYVVRVPTEQPSPTTQVRVLIPAGLKIYSIGPKEGWHYATKKDNSGRITEITWSDGNIPPNEFTEFEFLGIAPKQPGDFIWKAYQTYQNGRVDAWVEPPGAFFIAWVTKVESPAASEAAAGQRLPSGPAPSPRSVPAAVSWSALVLALVATSLSGYSLLR